MEQEQKQQQDLSKCVHCGSRSDTIYDKEASKMTFILSFVSLMVFGFYSIFMIPLIIQATKTIVKKCYDCNEVIESHDLFSLPSFNDKVLNFRFGSCAIILSRKYAYIILVLIGILYFFVGDSKQEQTEQLINSEYTNKTWEEYIQECGKDVFISNGVKAKSNFIKHYDNKIVQWEGVYIKFEASKNVLNKQYGIYIKMNPTDSIEGVQDIILIMESDTYKQYAQLIQGLNEGDIISFEGKLNHMGDEYSFHALNLSKLDSTGKQMNLDDIVPFDY